MGVGWATHAVARCRLILYAPEEKLFDVAVVCSYTRCEDVKLRGRHTVPPPEAGVWNKTPVGTWQARREGGARQ